MTPDSETTRPTLIELRAELRKLAFIIRHIEALSTGSKTWLRDRLTEQIDKEL